MYHTLCINICHYVNFEKIFEKDAIIIDGLVGFFLNCKDIYIWNKLEELIKPLWKKRVNILNLGFLDGEWFEPIRVNFKLSLYYNIGWLHN